MRLKCAESCDNLTIDRLYHMMDEDDEYYYIVNDSFTISKYQKDSFFISDSRVKIIENARFDMPNETEIYFVKNTIFKLHGRYKYNGKYMNVIIMKDNELPIAIPDHICEII